MLEAQNMGMKGLAIKPHERFPGARAQQGRLGPEAGPVEAVAEQRMADMGKMHPDLVGPAGLEPQGKEARHRPRPRPAIASHELPTPGRPPAPPPDRHPRP